MNIPAADIAHDESVMTPVANTYPISSIAAAIIITDCGGSCAGNDHTIIRIVGA